VSFLNSAFIVSPLCSCIRRKQLFGFQNGQILKPVRRPGPPTL